MDTKQFGSKQHFIAAAQTQWTFVQRLNPENQEISPYISCKQITEAKSNSTHIWLHVTLLAISFPQCYVTFFMFQLFKFPSLPPASLSEHSLSVSFLSLLHVTL
jgi:hypothetical protein